MFKTDEKTRERKRAWDLAHPDVRAEWYAKNREQLNEKKKIYARANPGLFKNSNLKRLYGIGLDEWQRMFDAQRGRCAICLKHQSSLKASLHVDHDHDTGVVRGLLCSSCNVMLGGARDGLETLTAAIQYLKQHKKEL